VLVLLAIYRELGTCCRKMRLRVYNMIDGGRRGRKPGYIHEMGSHDFRSCEVKCQRNSTCSICDQLLSLASQAMLLVWFFTQLRKEVDQVSVSNNLT
jgi:hypothetical protein